MEEKVLEKEPNWCGITFLIILEWWLHNIGYYMTLPFINNNNFLAHINLHCKDVDLIIQIKEEKGE